MSCRDISSNETIESILSTIDRRTILNVRRGQIWEDSCRALSRSGLTPERQYPCVLLMALETVRELLMLVVPKRIFTIAC